MANFVQNRLGNFKSFWNIKKLVMDLAYNIQKQYTEKVRKYTLDDALIV